MFEAAVPNDLKNEFEKKTATSGKGPPTTTSSTDHTCITWCRQPDANSASWFVCRCGASPAGWSADRSRFGPSEKLECAGKGHVRRQAS